MSNKLKKRNAKKVWFTTLLVAAFVTSTAGCSLLPKEEGMLKPPELVRPVESEIVTNEAKIGTIIRTVSGTGIFKSVSTVEHAFTEKGGRVAEVFFYSGDKVKKGDVLVRLETDGLDLDLLRSQLDWERKKLALDEARATGNTSRIKIASLDLEISQKALNKVKNLISNNVLRAKIDGIIISFASINIGNMVDVHNTLYTIADPAQMKLTYGTSSREALSQIEVGMVADIKLNGEISQGTVTQTPSSAPTVDDARLRETYANTVYIDMEPLPEKVRIGDSVSIQIVTDTREDVIVIPVGGLQENFGRTYVQVMEDDTRRDIDVEVGLRTATEVEIVKGLKAGQMVIIK